MWTSSDWSVPGAPTSLRPAAGSIRRGDRSLGATWVRTCARAKVSGQGGGAQLARVLVAGGASFAHKLDSKRYAFLQLPLHRNRLAAGSQSISKCAREIDSQSFSKCVHGKFSASQVSVFLGYLLCSDDKPPSGWAPR